MDIHTSPVGPNRPGVKARKAYLKIDMTPMVDLGFLLITFFVISTRLSAPKAMDLIVPTEGKSMPLANRNAISIIPSDERIFYFEGDFDTAVKENRVQSFRTVKQLRSTVMQKQEALDMNKLNGEGREGLMFVIKPLPDADYKTLVDILDEILILDVKKYALDKPTAGEKLYFEKQ